MDSKIDGFDTDFYSGEQQCADFIEYNLGP